ncbi:alpha/beta fold hydrolase [Nevskia sp.]|uniref:alpha/beta hydrolase n=1 Tax=Nevskia sp. TaxID=1929292 RepID=UPI0025E9F1AE|nr:alpha/beta fold hydrolase [Nevskia sp.]
MTITLTEIEFPSHGTTLRAGHFRPSDTALANDRGLPCIVMAHGLGGTRAAGLEPFARHFAEAGLAVLVFDYRGFGNSDGQPRQWVSVSRQLQDWAAAIAHARRLPGIDPDRIATWGSSFSGAHSVAAAVADGRIAAVSSQGALMDGLASLFHLLRELGPVPVLKLTASGLRDLASATLGRGRVTLPVIAAPGAPGVLTTADSLSGYSRITPPDWQNRITTSWALTLATYRPGLSTPKLPCPALFCIATGDVVVPPSAMEAAAKRAPDKVTVKRYPVGHFDIYVPPTFNDVVRDQTAFFVSTLKPA